MSNETHYVHKHVVSVLKAATGYATQLPGGIWRNIAPAKVTGRHLIMAYSGGLDVNAFSGGYVGAGMQLLLKVIDASESEINAVAAHDWLEAALQANNGSSVSGAYVYLDKLMPFNLPVVEDDIMFQQVGRTYNVFVDLI